MSEQIDGNNMPLSMGQLLLNAWNNYQQSAAPTYNNQMLAPKLSYLLTRLGMRNNNNKIRNDYGMAGNSGTNGTTRVEL